MPDKNSPVHEKMSIKIEAKDLIDGHDMSHETSAMMCAVLTFMATCPMVVPMFRVWLNSQPYEGGKQAAMGMTTRNFFEFARTIVEHEPELKRQWDELDAEMAVASKGADHED